jgi:pilus assembly protein CpaF
MSFEIILPFLKPIRHLIEAETVSEIMVNPDSTVWIEEYGRIQSLPGIRFEAVLERSWTPILPS